MTCCNGRWPPETAAAAAAAVVVAVTAVARSDFTSRATGRLITAVAEIGDGGKVGNRMGGDGVEDDVDDCSCG